MFFDPLTGTREAFGGLVSVETVHGWRDDVEGGPAGSPGPALPPVVGPGMAGRRFVVLVDSDAARGDSQDPCPPPALSVNVGSSRPRVNCTSGRMGPKCTEPGRRALTRPLEVVDQPRDASAELTEHTVPRRDVELGLLS